MQTGNRNFHVNNFSFVVQLEHLSFVQDECQWNEHTSILVAQDRECITCHRPGFSCISTVPFTFGFTPVVEPVILEFFWLFNIFLAQVGPNI